MNRRIREPLGLVIGMDDRKLPLASTWFVRARKQKSTRDEANVWLEHIALENRAGSTPAVSAAPPSQG